MTKFTVSYIAKDGREFANQIYTAEFISELLKNLIAQGATNIVVKSLEEEK